MKKVIQALKKFIKPVIIGMLVISMTSASVSAEGLHELGKIVDGSELTNKDSAEDIQGTLTRGNILNQGIAKITNLGNGRVNVYGSATCFVTCDKINVKLTLQRYSGGAWYNVEMYDDTAYNSATLTKSYNVSVSKGYYYRVKGACVAQKGGTTESKLPTTDGIWIG